MKPFLQKHAEKLKSPRATRAIGILVIFAALMASFSFGLQVGYNKAAFAYKFGDNYYQAFGPKKIRHGIGFIPEPMMKTHGVLGKIISIQSPTMIVTDNNGSEQTVRTTDQTLIKQQQTTVPFSMLKVGDYIVVLGSPNGSSEVEAKLIRMLPPPPETLINQTPN